MQIIYYSLYTHQLYIRCAEFRVMYSAWVCNVRSTVRILRESRGWCAYAVDQKYTYGRMLKTKRKVSDREPYGFYTVDYNRKDVWARYRVILSCVSCEVVYATVIIRDDFEFYFELVGYCSNNNCRTKTFYTTTCVMNFNWFSFSNLFYTLWIV